MVVELAAPKVTAQGLTRDQFIAAQRSATHEIKQQVLATIERLRHLDPDVEVFAQQSMFPVLLVRGSQAFLVALARLPEVLRMAPEQEGELL